MTKVFAAASRSSQFPRYNGAVPSRQSPVSLSISRHSSLSDKNLYHLCQLYGGNAKLWLRKFAGLLPEVCKRFLHLQRGCGSINEFAKKLSGMNERTTDKILSLHRRLADKPHLLALFESGEQGWSKLEAVAFIATVENEKDLAEMVKSLSQKALFEWVKNFREKQSIAQRSITIDGQAQNNLQIHQGHGLQINLSQEAQSSGADSALIVNDPMDPTVRPSAADLALNVNSTSGLATQSHDAVPTATEIFTTLSFPISAHSRQKLNLIKSSLEKKHRKTLTWNQVIELWPTMATCTSSPQIKVCPSCALQKIKALSSRHIPTAIRRLILATHGRCQGSVPCGVHGRICVFPNCNNSYTEFHHLVPYAICKKHDPKNIYPVCKTHHTLFHAGLIANSDKPPVHWRIRDKPIQNSIDKKAMKFKT